MVSQHFDCWQSCFINVCEDYYPLKFIDLIISSFTLFFRKLHKYGQILWIHNEIKGKSILTIFGVFKCV